MLPEKADTKRSSRTEDLQVILGDLEKCGKNVGKDGELKPCWWFQ